MFWPHIVQPCYSGEIIFARFRFFEMVRSIKPSMAHPSTYYREKLSWTISEDAWNQAGSLALELQVPIPGAVHSYYRHGGRVYLSRSQAGDRGVEFRSVWTEGVDGALVYIVHEDPIFFPTNPIFCPSHLSLVKAPEKLMTSKTP